MMINFYLLRVVHPVDGLLGCLQGLHLQGVQDSGETHSQAPNGIFTRESHLSCQLQPLDLLVGLTRPVAQLVVVKYNCNYLF